MIDWMAIALMALGLVTAVVSFLAAWEYRELNVPVSWHFFVAFGFGALSIALMYMEIAHVAYAGLSKSFLLPILRVMFGFVLTVTLLASSSVIIRAWRK